MIHATTVHGQTASRAQEYLVGWQRARAELDNFRKRAVAERSLELTRARAAVIEPLLTLSDNFAAMSQHVPAELADNAWAEGVLHIARQLETLLADYGVERIAPAGQPFDPTQHEAIEQVEQPNQTSGLVIEVVQAGYRVGERVLRPAKVRIAA